MLETDSYTTQTENDALGRLHHQVNPDTSETKPEYHLSGHLNRVTTRLKGETTYTEQVSSITYNPKGQRERITYGNGTYTDYTYEATTYRLKTLVTTRTSDSKVLQNISYTYDPVGNITIVNDASIPAVFSNNQQVQAKQKFTYDALYRLKVAEGREHIALNNPDYYKDPAAYKQSAFIHITDVNDANKLANYTRYYTYDKAGSMLTVQHVAADSQRSFTRTIRVEEDSNRWLPANMGNNLTISDYYDANGNIQELETLVQIKWNYRDNISSGVTVERTGNINDAEYYVYDASGQRVRKVKETLTSVVNGTVEIEEKIYLRDLTPQEGEGATVEVKKIRVVQGGTSTTILNRTSLHIMDDTRRIATVHNWTTDTLEREINSQGELNTNKIRYQYGNHIDSASLELDSSGSIISYEEYFPYGDTSLIAGTAQKEVKLKEYRYTGKEKDDATGLYYYGARYYASWLGRWMSCDPLFRNNPAVYDRPKGSTAEEQQRQHEEYMQKLYGEGLNMYCYVRGNPVTFSDPSGRDSKSFSTHHSERSGLWAVGDWMHEWFGSGSSHIKENKVNDSGGNKAVNGTGGGTTKTIMENLKYNNANLPIPKEKGIKAIGSPVGRRDAIKNKDGDIIIGKHFHKGQDYKVPIGTPYLATVEGTVIKTRFKTADDKTTDKGNFISIKDIYGNIHTGVHLSNVKVSVGDKVMPGQVIGLTGNSGKLTTGAHLHESITKGDNEKHLWDIKSNKWIEQEWYNKKTGQYKKYKQ